MNGYMAYPVSVAIDTCFFSNLSNATVNILEQSKDQDFQAELYLVAHLKSCS